ncbi:MAG: hypothetical protein IPN74_16895 [Haliscomenobacter sp.]|nr:hypothetical protein [Haliscomenobacter sp.]
MEGFLFKEGAFLWFENGRVRPVRVTLPNGRAGEILNYATLRPWNGRETDAAVIARDPSSDIQYLYALEGIDSVRLLLSHIPADAYQRFSQDADGNWWVGTSSGLLRSDERLLTFRTNDPNMAPALHAIGEDAEGRIWLGGYGSSGGFSVFDGALLRRAPFDGVPIPVLPGSGTPIGGTLYFFTERFPGIAGIRNGRLRWQEFPEHQGKGNLAGYFILPLQRQVAPDSTCPGRPHAQQNRIAPVPPAHWSGQRDAPDQCPYDRRRQTAVCGLDAFPRGSPCMIQSGIPQSPGCAPPGIRSALGSSAC